MCSTKQVGCWLTLKLMHTTQPKNKSRYTDNVDGNDTVSKGISMMTSRKLRLRPPVVSRWYRCTTAPIENVLLFWLTTWHIFCCSTGSMLSRLSNSILVIASTCIWVIYKNLEPSRGGPKSVKGLACETNRAAHAPIENDIHECNPTEPPIGCVIWLNSWNKPILLGCIFVESTSQSSSCSSVLCLCGWCPCHEFL